MDSADFRRLLADSSVAVLSSITSDGTPHSVPICFALDGDFVYFAVDHKPKKSTDLKRLHNIAANPTVAVLVHHYERDWNRLWWVRVDGSARVLAGGDESQHAVALLADRYEQYRTQPPAGPVVAIRITRISGWSAT